MKIVIFFIGFLLLGGGGGFQGWMEVSLFMTSLVIILNFSLYMISNANVFKNMGILVIAGIAAALITDYFVTPVLFKYFQLMGKEKNKDDSKDGVMTA